MPGQNAQGYVVDIQSDFLADLRTRVVVPLVPSKSVPPPIRDLNPVIQLGLEPHVFLTQSLSSIPVKELRRPVGSVRDQHDVITRALDLLLVGF
jgi:toxin CcdB